MILSAGLLLRAQTRHYVKIIGAGTQTGLSWANAAPATALRYVIANAGTTDTVWVQGSTTGAVYYPTASIIRDSAFVLANGVAVYGGFAGTETALSQRNISTYVTILSGDIGVAGNNSDNSYHVVVFPGTTSTAILDGFTIEYGNAIGANTFTYNGVAPSRSTGGGIVCFGTGASPKVSNCTIVHNRASGNGGGGYLYNAGSPVFTDCSFSNDSTAVTGQYNGGGGIYASGVVASFTGVTFSADTSGSEGGGVLVIPNGSYIFTSCTFSNNLAGGNGGGLAKDNGSPAILLTGCTFTNNKTTTTTAGDGGGGVYNANTGMEISNCSFSGNSSSAYGGGVLNSSSGMAIYHCSFSGNNAGTYGGGYANTGGNTDSTAFCHFSNNAATYGGATYISGGKPFYYVDTFSNNTATAASGMAGGGVFNDASANSDISHCWFLGNVATGGDGAGQYDLSGAAGTDSNCVFQANVGKGTASNGGGIYHGASGNMNLYNCVFVNNSCTANGGGLYDNASSSTFEISTYYNNTAVTGAGIYEAGGGSTKYYGDIVWGNNTDGIAFGAGSTTGIKVKYNDFTTAAPFTGSNVVGNISANPGFAYPGTPAGNDGKWGTIDDGLHLISTSLAANVNQTYIDNDIVDVIRPYPGNTYADMGAYEGPGNFTILAIQLLNFTATKAGANTVNLNWYTDVASQATAYHVQKSINGTDFSSIGAVEVVSGETSYEFVDRNAIGATIYYRIQIIRAVGGEGFSSILIITSAQDNGQLSLRPTVAEQGTTTLYIGSPQAASLNLVIVDASGRVLSRRFLSVNRGDNYIPLDVSGFPRGLYYVNITGQGGLRKTLPLESL
jgi:parallel beta-helix repeat protein